MDTKGKLVKVTRIEKSEEEYEDSSTGKIIPIGTPHYRWPTYGKSSTPPKKSELAVSFYFKRVYRIEELLEKVDDAKDINYVEDSLKCLISSQEEHLLDLNESKIRSVRNNKLEERINTLSAWLKKIENNRLYKELRKLKYGE